MSNEQNPPTPSIISKAASFLGFGAELNKKLAGLERELETAKKAETTELQKLDGELEQLEAKFSESGSAELAGQIAEREAARSKVASWHKARLEKLEKALAAAREKHRLAEIDAVARTELGAIVARAEGRSALIAQASALCSKLEPIISPRTVLSSEEAEARLRELLATELPAGMDVFAFHVDVPLASVDDIDALKSAAERLHWVSLRLSELHHLAASTRSAIKDREDRIRWAAEDAERKKREAEHEKRKQQAELRRHPERALRVSN